jgi:hypothetical protein
MNSVQFTVINFKDSFNEYPLLPLVVEILNNNDGLYAIFSKILHHETLKFFIPLEHQGFNAISIGE